MTLLYHERGVLNDYDVLLYENEGEAVPVTRQ